MSAAEPELRVIASGPDVASVMEKLRVRTDERAGERLRDCGLLTADEVSELMLAGVRGG